MSEIKFKSNGHEVGDGEVELNTTIYFNLYDLPEDVISNVVLEWLKNNQDISIFLGSDGKLTLTYPCEGKPVLLDLWSIHRELDLMEGGGSDFLEDLYGLRNLFKDAVGRLDGMIEKLSE